jgi:hypothetical protein
LPDCESRTTLHTQHTQTHTSLPTFITSTPQLTPPPHFP